MSESSWVMYFPITVPEGAITREDYTAMEHLQIWLLYQQHYCEHKPSVTISVKDREWMEVGGWVHKNFDWVSGIAFLPFAGGNYRQAPYITCTKEQFEELKAKTPTTIDWSEFKEDSDYTEAAKEFACMGGFCEV
jgi:ribonucleoside-diphosphate reductase alpha chain